MLIIHAFSATETTEPTGVKFTNFCFHTSSRAARLGCPLTEATRVRHGTWPCYSHDSRNESAPDSAGVAVNVQKQTGHSKHFEHL